jgi:hypothetical protein
MERDEDKAERSFKISKSVSAAYMPACPRIDLLESREKQTVKMLTFVFLSLPFKILKKKISRKRRNPKFQGKLFHFISTLLDDATSEDHSSGARIYLSIQTKYVHYCKPVPHTKGDPLRNVTFPRKLMVRKWI